MIEQDRDAGRKALSVALGTVMFGLFGAGHGAAWFGIVFGASYVNGAVIFGVITGVFAFLAGTRWVNRFAPLGAIQLIAQVQQRGKIEPSPMSNMQMLAYRGLSSFFVPFTLATLFVTVVAAVIRSF